MRTLQILAIAVLCTGALAAEVPGAETTLDDQASVAVTAYNNGLALVRDVRTLSLPEGEVMLQFMDVAEQIRPETVSLRSTAAPGSVTIFEQNYEYDLISPAKLMEKYVGKQVRLTNMNTDIGFSEVTAELLSVNQGPVYKVNGEIYLGHPGNVVLPEIPVNLIAKPSLIWTLGNRNREQTLEATYLTNGISWRADYVVTLAKDDASLDVAGWVTMDNQSGATYQDATLKLVAGEVNVVRPQRSNEEFGALGYFAGDKMAEAMPREESFAEYHLYTMPRKTTIKQNQSKQLRLLSGTGVKCAKKYEYRGQVHFYSNRIPPMKDEHIGVSIEFRNDEANQLGIPLPAGVMRIYQEDSDGMLQFAGEDRIGHTPKDEDVRLRMGNAFDVIGERVQTDYERLSDRVHECEFEITLCNHKESGIVVDVVEPMPGDWTISNESRSFVKRDAHTAVFSVPLEKDGEVKLTYRVRVRY